jgi:hypothetical protein
LALLLNARFTTGTSPTGSPDHRLDVLSVRRLGFNRRRHLFGPESRLWTEIERHDPFLAEHEHQAGRVIPVVVLTRRPGVGPR